jgi:hypothetical protein
MVIDCGRCVMRGTSCHDCVITVLGPERAQSGPPETPQQLDASELRALSVLADAGLVPPLRLSLPSSPIKGGSRSWVQNGFPVTKAS